MVDTLLIVMPARNVKPVLPCWIHVLQNHHSSANRYGLHDLELKCQG